MHPKTNRTSLSVLLQQFYFPVGFYALLIAWFCHCYLNERTTNERVAYSNEKLLRIWELWIRAAATFVFMFMMCLETGNWWFRNSILESPNLSASTCWRRLLIIVVVVVVVESAKQARQIFCYIKRWSFEFRARACELCSPSFLS